MTEEKKLRQEYRTKVGSTYNAKWEWYAEWLEKQLLIAREELSKLHQPTVSCSLPSKDEAVNVGFRKATVEGYNYRRVCRVPDHDIYYSGWMDCYDWLSGNYR